MGNCFGKEDSSNFRGEGRSLASSNAQAQQQQQPRARPPPEPSRATKPSQRDAGRPLGGSSRTGTDGSVNDPREAARLAAEERANKQNAPKGKLGEQLAAQKKQTRTDTLEQVSRENRGARDADANAELRNWN